jgi:hypothetical protein
LFQELQSTSTTDSTPASSSLEQQYQQLQLQQHHPSGQETSNNPQINSVTNTTTFTPLPNIQYYASRLRSPIQRVYPPNEQLNFPIPSPNPPTPIPQSPTEILDLPPLRYDSPFFTPNTPIPTPPPNDPTITSASTPSVRMCLLCMTTGNNDCDGKSDDRSACTPCTIIRDHSNCIDSFTWKKGTSSRCVSCYQKKRKCDLKRPCGQCVKYAEKWRNQGGCYIPPNN